MFEKPGLAFRVRVIDYANFSYVLDQAVFEDEGDGRAWALIKIAERQKAIRDREGGEDHRWVEELCDAIQHEVREIDYWVKQ